MMADDDQAVELKGPGGIGFNFKGNNTTLLTVLLFLVMCGAILLVIYQHEAQAQVRQSDNVKRDTETKEVIKALTDAVKSQEKNQEAMIYVLTLPQDQREKLNLNRPDRLREMQR